MLRSPSRLGVVAAFATALVFTLGSCSDSTAPKIALKNYITKVTNGDGTVTATLRSGSPPAAGSGPTITVSGNAAFITGGSTFRNVEGSAAFNHVIVAITGVSGYYDLALPSNETAEDIVLELAQTLPKQAFTLAYAVGAGGTFGSIQSEDVSVVQVGTGDVQVSVSWNAESDVDLHLVEPGGEEIYYSNDISAAGGKLDLDSNAGCSIDGVKNENITYPGVTPPRGTYTVRVDYWSSCTVPSTNYVVTIHVKGKNPVTYTGTFTGDGDGGGAGAGVTIGTFTF